MCRPQLEGKLNKYIGRQFDDCIHDEGFLNIVADLRVSGVKLVGFRNSLGFITGFIKQNEHGTKELNHNTVDFMQTQSLGGFRETNLFGKPAHLATSGSPVAADTFLAAFRQSIIFGCSWLTPRLHRVAFNEQLMWYEKKDKENRSRAVLEWSLYIRIKGGYATSYDKLKYYILSRMNK